MKKIVLKDGSVKEFKDGKMEMMGIINVTPNSFFAGSRTYELDPAVERAEEFIKQGATFIDVGGESTRPGSDPVEVEEEMRRVCPVIKEIKRRHPEVLVSVDTYNSNTAREAIKNGADIVNDISGLTFDPEMVKVIAEEKVPVIIMHINGKPKTMQKNPHYNNVVEEVYEFLENQVNFAIENGVSRDKIIIDLGIGFGKTCEHNIELLRNIDYFDKMELPHLLAVSRKTFIGKILEEEDPAGRLYGTIAVTLYAQCKGIEIARVHDVLANKQAVKMMEVLR